MNARPTAAQRGTGRLLVWCCHLGFYLVLAGGTVAALAQHLSRWPLTVPLVAAAAGWYAYWNLSGSGRPASGTRACVVYGAVAAVLWLGLMGVDRAYAVVGVLALAQLLVSLDRWAALGGTVATIGLTVAAGGFGGSLAGPRPLAWHGIDWGDALGTALVLALIALAIWLDREAAAARNELAAAERRTGALAERARLAADLHDTLTQNLASVVMLLEAAQDSYRSGTRDAGARLESALATTRASLRDIRGLVWELRPEALEQQTLDLAITGATTQLTEQSDIAARTVVTGEPRRLPAETEQVLLRVAEEALANVRRHSGARDVTVTLSYIDDLVVLDVTDDGVGFDAATRGRPDADGGLGLVTMRERTEAAGGTFTVESTPGEGTSVAAQLPVARGARATALTGVDGRSP